MRLLGLLFPSRLARDREVITSVIPMVIAESFRATRGMVDVFNQECDTFPNLAGTSHAVLTVDASQFVALSSALPFLGMFAARHPSRREVFADVANWLIGEIGKGGWQCQMNSEQEPDLSSDEINPVDLIAFIERVPAVLEYAERQGTLIETLAKCYRFSLRKLDGNASDLIARFDEVGRLQLNAMSNVTFAKKSFR